MIDLENAIAEAIPAAPESAADQVHAGQLLVLQAQMNRSAAQLIEPQETIHRSRVAAALTEQPRPGHGKFLGRLAVRVEDKLILVRLPDVFWVQSRGNLLRLHLRETGYDCRMTMKDLHSQLDPEKFLRVHRNAIVNLDHVVEFDLPRFGNAYVHLRNGKSLPISRTGRLALRRSLLSRRYVEADAS